MTSIFLRELTLSVVLLRPGTEVLAVQILRFPENKPHLNSVAFFSVFLINWRKKC
jgi:ABC-type Fe3+ transport system permease subunit